jgi:hypothetical protein
MKSNYPCPCPRCNGTLVSHRTLRRHRKSGQTIQSVADWRRQQGRPLRPEDLGVEGDIEGNEGESNEEEGGNGQEGFVLGPGRAQKRGRFDVQVCAPRP